MTLLCYSRCTTCQATIQALNEAGIQYEVRDIKQQNPDYEEIKEWHKNSGLPLKKFFNTSGLLYKSLDLKEKLPNMSEDEQLKLLATDGMLVKRPLMIDGKIVKIGKKEILGAYA